MAANRKSESNNIGSQFSKLIFKYLPYWPLFLILTIISVAYAWYKLQHQTPMYAASTRILIKDDSKKSKVIDELDAVSPYSNTENELEVLRSQELMTNVVKNLGLYAPVYEEGRFIPHPAYESSPIVIHAQIPDSIIEESKIPFEYLEKRSSVKMGGNEYPLNTWVNTKYGILKFTANKYQSKSPEGPLYFSLYRPINVSPGFVGRLNINMLSKTSAIILLGTVDEVPKRAEHVLDELVQVYNQAGIIDKNTLAANTLKFIVDRLAYVSQDLDSIEHQIQRYRQSENAFDVGAQGGMYLENVSQANQNIADINMQLAALNQVENYVLAKGERGSIVPSTFGIEDPSLTQLLDRLYTAEMQYEKLKQTVGENNPLVASVMKDISKIKPSILDNIQSHKASLLTTRRNLYAVNSSYTARLQSMPKKERELLSISREQAIKNSIYTFLLQKREETALSYASTIPDSRVLDKASSSSMPISPNPKRSYTTAIILALLIGIALITANDMFRSTILYRHEIETATSFPVIAEIGYDKGKNLLITEAKNSMLPDNFRKLRTSLTFLGIGAKRKKILVTSSIPGEGKSFVAANLGLSLALAGKKVVLLELDLINPTLSKKLGVYEENGLSQYLVGDMELEEIIKPASTHENMFIVPSGPLPLNPSELLLNGKVQDLLVQLDSLFDCIIIDTAPVGPITDAYVLSSYCDTTLYVVRHKYTPKSIIQRIDDENKINHLKNAAIVFNGVKSKGFGSDKYGYGYGYVYGYTNKKQLKNDKERKKLIEDRKS